MQIKVYDTENKRLTSVDSIEFSEGKVTQVVTAPGRNQLFPGQFKLVQCSDRVDANKNYIYEGDILLVDSPFGVPFYAEVTKELGMFKIEDKPLNIFTSNDVIIVGSIFENDGKIRKQ